MDSKHELISLHVLKGPLALRGNNPDVAIYYCLAGSATVETPHETVPLGHQDLLLVNSDTPHTLSAQDAHVLRFDISRAELRRCFPDSPLRFACNSVTSTNDSIGLLRSYLQEYVTVHYEQTKLMTAETNRIFYEIATLLASRFMDRLFEGSSDERIEAVYQYVNDHYAEPLSLRSMGEAFFVTPQYFSKYFKERSGKTFHAYVQDVRLQHAMHAVESSEDTLLRIALDNGFPNAESFRKAFAERYGMGPLAYRKQVAEQRQLDVHDAETSLDETVLLLGETHRVKTEAEIFSVDATVHVPYRAFWRDSVSIGELSLLENYELREQLAQMQKDLRFTYIRFTVGHVLRANEQPTFHFEERQFDYFYQLKLREWIVIPFSEDMPIDLYERYLRDLIAYFANRYDITNVLSWRYELAATRLTADNRAWYAQCFRRLQQVLNSFGYRKELLGANISLQDFESIDAWAEILGSLGGNVPVQTFRTSSTVAVQTDTGQTIQRASDSAFITDQWYAIGRRAPAVQDAVRGILLTSWSGDVSERSVLYDSCYRGAATIKNMISCFGDVASLTPSSPFDATDASSSSGDFLFGGVGLMTREGLPKPSYFAYELMNRAGKRYVAKQGHAIVFSNGEANYQIICHNCKHLSYRYYTSGDDMEAGDLARYFEDDKDLEITIRLVSARRGTYVIKKRSISPAAGSIQDELLRVYGTVPSYVHPNERLYLERVTMPRVEVKQVEVANDVLEFTIRLEANEFAQIHAIYQFA